MASPFWRSAPVLVAISVTILATGTWWVYWGGTLLGAPPPSPPRGILGTEPTVRSAVSVSDPATTPTTSPSLRTAPGDAIVVWVSLFGLSAVNSLTDTAGDAFRPVLNSTMAYGTTGAYNGLSIWIATGVHGGPTSVVTTLRAGCSECAISSAIVVVDVTGVGVGPIGQLGRAVNSSGLENQESRGFSCSVGAGSSHLILAGVAARNLDYFASAGGDVLVDQQATGLSGVSRAMTTAVFEQTEGADGSTVALNGTDNQSSAWVAAALAMTPAAPAHAPTFRVVFSDDGLASGTVWTVTLGGVTSAGVAPGAISFLDPDGTYSFAVGQIAGYTQSPASGSLLIDGAAEEIAIHFASAARPIQHVVVIVLENQELDAASGGSPYLDYLSTTYANVTEFFAACHGSLPDYASVTSGRYFACGASGIPESTVTDLPDLIERGGDSWAGYFEAMPQPCDTSDAGSYLIDHNPFLLYQDILGNASRCASHVVNSAAFNASVRNGTLPTVSLYIPDEYDDCHSSSLAYCSAWLKGFLGPILNSTSGPVQALVAHTAFIVMFDEGSSDAGYAAGGDVNDWCANQTGEALATCGGHTYLTVVSPYSVGTVYTAPSSDFNVVSTIEWLFGLGSDGGWDGTPAFPSMNGVFSFETNQ